MVKNKGKERGAGEGGVCGCRKWLCERLITGCDEFGMQG